jgi:hypothetical protein
MRKSMLNRRNDMVTLTCWIPADACDKAVKLAAAAGKSLEQWLHDVVLARADNILQNQD